ncbi:MAG: segregation/condensation protein A [Candidatus Margulisiibacteriota bacterium]|jgi:segregation and condensation protein A
MYEIRLENFSGPFDLLLHLIEEQEMDIYAVPIGKITDEYLHYIENMRENKLEVGSEFLMLATTLLELKSRSLLPADSVEVDDTDLEFDRLSLLDRLVEYKLFKEISEELGQKASSFQDIFFRDKAVRDYIKANNILPRTEISGASVTKLLQAFEDLWKRKILDEIEDKEITEDTVTVRDKIGHILDSLSTERFLTFTQLFSENPSRVEIIVTFLAVLEITRRQLIYILQDEDFGEIRIERAWGAAVPLIKEEDAVEA